jgi:hypothetical protein
MKAEVKYERDEEGAMHLKVGLIKARLAGLYRALQAWVT